MRPRAGGADGTQARRRIGRPNSRRRDRKLDYARGRDAFGRRRSTPRLFWRQTSRAASTTANSPWSVAAMPRRSKKLLDAISTGVHGAIALAYVEWAGESEQMIVVDWAVIRNAADGAPSPRHLAPRRALSSDAPRLARRSISPSPFSVRPSSPLTVR